MKVLVVGAGILGLATAARLARRGDEVVVVDKEPGVAHHQTGHNSGVIHSGLYYAPGSLKARLGTAGAASMTAFAQDHGVPVRTCGKLVVAVDDAELPALAELARRAEANGVPARLIDAAEAREYEPNVSCVRALRVESTGIVDYVGVCEVLAGQIADGGGQVRFGRTFRGARTVGGRVRARVDVLGADGAATDTGREDVVADALVVCGGLHADRLADACDVVPQARIVPFRGEYFELAPAKTDLVRTLIYPVPDPRFPFLGVHLTTMIGGGVHAGPNAVLALAREGYTWRDVNLADLRGSLSWPGLWHLGRRNLVPGANEVIRSLSRTRFAASLSRLVPGITAADLVPAPAGVRAQALRRDGSLVDDFLIQRSDRQLHVLNAPSPAATASLEIAAHLESELDAMLAAEAR
ncbi:L-2-hydroxyglutarate oxidase [Occultella glacieicola]|uniref:L-2-hydroxyglutarate oxidase n=1 Tax=Occultella glacieicola TaxID=2518684 RepID=UPI001A9ED0A3|nr:L-2-hydroxyglutarate oxidase [Occultella glacieicola]